MIGIGFQEVLVVLVAAFVLIGPSRLLKLADQLGRWMRARPTRDRHSRDQPQQVAWFNHRSGAPRGEQLIPLGSLAVLTPWIWVIPVTLSIIGILVAVDNNDQQMFGRSATVFLASLILQASTGALTERPR